MWWALLGLPAAATALAAWRRGVARRFEAADDARRPRDASGVVRGAEEIVLGGTNGSAVLLLHGFNDTPQSMQYLATRLQARGYAVHVPRLPGHGCGLAELARDARASRWRETVDSAYAALEAEHRTVFVCGQSMGGALAVSLAVAHPELPALALLAPFIGLEPRFRRQFRLARLSPAPYFVSSGGERSIHDPVARRAALGPGIVTASALQALSAVAQDAERVVGQLVVPTLYVQSVHDNRVSKESASVHYSVIPATKKQMVWLEDSGHIISADFERARVAQLVADWFDAHR